MQPPKTKRQARAGLEIQAIQAPDVQIERFLKEQIEGGKLQPGERLPAIQDLAARWQVAKNTVQKAIARLVAEGLVVTAPKRGTCVSHEEQKLKIAILSDANLLEEAFYFPRALCKHITQEVERLDGNWQCEIYDGLSEGNTAALIHDAERNLIKGVIELNGRQMERLGLESLAKLPRARLSQAWQPDKSKDSGDYDVALDFGSFGFDVFSHLIGKEFKNIVYFRTFLETVATSADIKGIQTAAKLHGVSLPEIRQIKGHLHPIHGVEFEEIFFKLTQDYLETCQKKNAWPDAVMVSDDIAARAIALAIVKCVPEGRYPYVLTTANEGVQLHYGLPVVRYEYPVSLIGETLLSILKARLTRDTPPETPIYIRGTWMEHKERRSI